MNGHFLPRAQAQQFIQLRHVQSVLTPSLLRTSSTNKKSQILSENFWNRNEIMIATLSYTSTAHVRRFRPLCYATTHMTSGISFVAAILKFTLLCCLSCYSNRPFVQAFTNVWIARYTRNRSDHCGSVTTTMLMTPYLPRQHNKSCRLPTDATSPSKQQRQQRKQLSSYGALYASSVNASTEAITQQRQPSVLDVMGNKALSTATNLAELASRYSRENIFWNATSVSAPVYNVNVLTSVDEQGRQGARKRARRMRRTDKLAVMSALAKLERDSKLPFVDIESSVWVHAD